MNTDGATDGVADGTTDATTNALLSASGLPQRWQGRERFVVLDTDFGCGHAFIALWRSWRADPQRCTWLSVVAVCEHPPSRAGLQAAHETGGDVLAALLSAWPPSTPDLHTLNFEHGRVQLRLVVGTLRERLAGLRLQADAVLAGATAFEDDARLIDLLARKAATGCTLVAAGGAGQLPRLPNRGGFVQRSADARAQVAVADFAPRFVPRRLPEAGVSGRTAVVVGAGIGGAAVAGALARSGFEVTVFDRHDEPAAAASGNPAGLFHGVLHAGDGLYARLYRAAALQAHATYAEAIAEAGVPGHAQGLLRSVTPPSDLASMQALLARSGLPATYVQALDAEAGSARAGVPLLHPAWYYPGGGWIDPRAWVRQALEQPGVRFVGGVDVTELRASPDADDQEAWWLQDRDGAVLARAAVVVLASGAGTAALAPMTWPLSRSRGRITYWLGVPNEPTPLRIALAGAGYALPLPDGGLVCGATNEADIDPLLPDPAPELRPIDHQHNLQQLRELCGLAPPESASLIGKVGWRVHTPDRLPIAGALPLQPLPARQDQVRLLPRMRGLFVLTALGSRGLTLAPLLAELIAAQACGAPWPIPQDLADAVDPARWLVRAARAEGSC
ncbi:MAG: FAD-dependent 5-carboxymethylaminomethyl-2-thiouridine(34) oxidoreductase MnmC [Pseudomonadota bacterium]|nr:FAD-dependent 5-carboxymethylaminomethyl-2-thiouridine(34) oxidoreductase MnmC [Pseudomonadota bacterium]